MPQIQTVRLERGFHIICRDVDRATVVTRAAEFVDSLTMSGHVRQSKTQ
jgi:hypothetical protein